VEATEAFEGAETGTPDQRGQKHYPASASTAGVRPPLSRRRLLALGGTAAATGLAGCIGSLTGSDDDVCAPGYVELDQRLDGYAVADALRYASLSLPATVPLGGTVEAELTNESSEPLATLGEPRYAVQRLGDDGAWHTTVGVAEDYEWPRTERVLAPGERLQWTVTLRRGEFPGPFERCTAHTAGTYRFVYWGFGPRENSTDDGDGGVALAAPFEVVE